MQPLPEYFRPLTRRRFLGASAVGWAALTSLLDARGDTKAGGAERVVKDGLAIKLQLPKKKFTPDVPVEFKITLENVTEKPFLIERDADTFDKCCTLVVTNVASGDKYLGTAEWLTRAKLRPSAGHELRPGLPLVHERDAKLGKWQFVVQGERDNVARPKVRESLPVGQYRLEVRVRLGKPGRDPERAALWLGEITTKPVEFEISEKARDGAKDR